MATTKAQKMYTEVTYEPDCYIMFEKKVPEFGEDPVRKSGTMRENSMVGHPFP